MNLLAFSSLFLADGVVLGLGIGLGLAVVVALVGGYFLGSYLNKKATDKKLGDVQSRSFN